MTKIYSKISVAELKYESGCRDVAVLRLYKDFGIMQNHSHTWNQQRPKIFSLLK
ncbi:hypothetical protein [Nostoc sp. UHCC 0251]|uniref:hypothetical protein n=1 Tax=Nostoc sp. UHCC 0251 TaxID=3110240 RepID=UPI002B1F1115|nr:hypothetical protein [Nostoc sp. UHCC 0251]